MRPGTAALPGGGTNQFASACSTARFRPPNIVPHHPALKADCDHGQDPDRDLVQGALVIRERHAPLLRAGGEDALKIFRYGRREEGRLLHRRVVIPVGRRISSLFVPPPDQDRPFPFRLEFPPELPISARAEEIVATDPAAPVVILAGETGSGKTTQIPKMCLAAGRGTPRADRLHPAPPRGRAVGLAARGRGTRGGVGPRGRLQDPLQRPDHAATVIKFLTDGMLLAEVQGDPLLANTTPSSSTRRTSARSTSTSSSGTCARCATSARS
jgi:hypothetical protein